MMDRAFWGAAKRSATAPEGGVKTVWILLIVLGIVVGMIASHKGRSFFRGSCTEPCYSPLA